MRLSKIVISNKLVEKLNKTDFSGQVWNEMGINNANDLLESVKKMLNSYNTKLNIRSIESGNTNDKHNMHTSLLINKDNVIIAYIFFISPGSIARNTFLAQQVYSGLQNIINNNCINSNSNDVYNKPVYIINMNNDNSQFSKLVTIKGAKTIGLHYIDLFPVQILKVYSSIDEYDIDLKILKNGKNNWYTIDSINKIVKFHTGINNLQNATSDRYEFLARQIPAVALAFTSGYKIDISSVEENINKETVSSFINYAKKLYNL